MASGDIKTDWKTLVCFNLVCFWTTNLSLHAATVKSITTTKKRAAVLIDINSILVGKTALPTYCEHNKHCGLGFNPCGNLALLW
jgi:hypothetical protein